MNYLHKDLIEEYQLNIAEMPTKLQSAITEFDALEKEVAERRQDGKISAVHIDDSNLSDNYKSYLDKPYQPAEFNGATLRELLTPATQQFFAKGTHRLFGIKAYVLWQDDKNYYPIYPALWRAIQLPDIGEYKGKWEAEVQFDFDKTDYEGLLNQASEQITLMILELGKKEVEKEQSCLSDLEKKGNDVLYKEFRFAFREKLVGEGGEHHYLITYHRAHPEYVKIKIEPYGSGYMLYVNYEWRNQQVKTEISIFWQRENMTAVSYQDVTPVKTTIKKRYKNYSTCELNSKTEIKDLDRLVGYFLNQTIGYKEKIKLSTEIEKLKMELAAS